MDQTLSTTRTPNIDMLQQAARYIEKCLIKDNSAPTLQDQLYINPQAGPTVSGLTDHDYPMLQGLPAALAMKTQIKTLNKVPLPPEILEHFNHMQSHCMMGLFPEIHRAWLTIDSDIYVWTYEDGGDVAYYDGLNETIISVGLIKPKPGVFQSFIKYLLVLTTAVDIVVLGVTFSTNGDDECLDEIQLVSEPVFTIPTDGATMTTVAGTINGRLFLGSKDGCLYEITYQAASSWFGKRCRKINHSTSKLAWLVPSFAYAAITEEDGIAQIAVDDSRHILYILSEKGAIEVFDLGEDGNSISKIIRVSQNTLVTHAHNTVKTLDSQNFHPIISISPVELSESARICLVAVTQAGARMYLTTFTMSQMNNPLPRPATLQLQHVRLPPGFSASSHYRPRNIHMATYRQRNTLMVSSLNDKEVLWSVSSDLFPFYPIIMEAYSNIDLDGPALAICEVKYNTNLLLQPTQQVPPLIVRQHSEPPRKFVILTSQGAHILMKLRPVDLLKQLLLDTRAQDAEALKAYFTLQQDDQACATSLILASLEAPQNLDIADYATNAFFVFGGEPKLTSSVTSNQTLYNTVNQNYPGGNPQQLFLPNMMSTPMYQHSPFNTQNQTFGAAQNQLSTPLSPLAAANNTFTGDNQLCNSTMQPMNLNQSTLIDYSSPFQFSSKHNGLYLYLSRILRPLWNLRCVEKMTLDGKKFYLTSTLNSEECSWILCHLVSLRGFLQKNTQLNLCNNTMTNLKMKQVSQLNQSQMSNQTNQYTIQDAQLEERHSLDALKSFVNHACEVIGLWKILCEHQFHVLMEGLESQHQQIMQNTSFKDVLLYGHDVCATLINVLINSYLGDNASVDSISSKLREVCPSLYKIEDAACSKANEILKLAKSVNNINEKEDLLRQALMLCKDVAPNVNLKEICEQFSVLKSYNAVIELCLCCAQKVDPENISLLFYKNGDQNDHEGAKYYTRRMEIYREVVAMLEAVHAQCEGTNISNISATGVQEPRPTVLSQIITNIMRQKDELLHIAVYEWMMSKQMHHELIKTTESSLETYLQKASHINPTNHQILDILWKYYETNDNHAAAAKVLNTLATTKNNGLTLKDRLSYLARALICMRNDNIGYAPYLGVFLRELEDRLEVAKVQEKILDAIEALEGRNPEAKIAVVHLNSALYDITQLYEDFAEKFNLWECKLSIIDCAGYNDTNLIESIWHNIFQNELLKSTVTGNDKVIQILAKLKIIMRTYKANSVCVPLDYIINELEFISANMKADPSLVPNFFVTMGYPIDILVHTYNNVLIKSLKDNFWLLEENRNRHAESITALMNAFVHTHDKYNNVEKRKLISLCQDTVASLLSSLYSKPNTEHIITALRNIQSKLSRM